MNGLIQKHFNRAFLYVLQLTDYVGFGLSKKGELMRFRIESGNGNKYAVKGVLCSSNYEASDQSVISIFGCEEVFAANQKCSFERSNTVIPGQCPKGCLQ